MRIRAGTIADIPELSRLFAKSWRATYEGWTPEVFVKGVTEGASAKIFAESLQPNEFSYFLHVAEVGGRLVGFADGGKERSHPEKGIGELYALYLLKEFQGQGLGRKLLEASIKSLGDAGLKSPVVWVLEQSPARKFYEALGGKLQPGIKTLDILPRPIELVCYGWNGAGGPV